MFLLVSGRHAGAHPDGHQLGVFIQISFNLGKKTSPHILLKKNCCKVNLAETRGIFAFFLFPDSGLNLLNDFISILIYFECRDTANLQLIELGQD